MALKFQQLNVKLILQDFKERNANVTGIPYTKKSRAECTHSHVQATHDVTESCVSLTSETDPGSLLPLLDVHKFKKSRDLEISGEVNENPVRHVLHIELKKELIGRTHFQAQETHIPPDSSTSLNGLSVRSWAPLFTLFSSN